MKALVHSNEAVPQARACPICSLNSTQAVFAHSKVRAFIVEILFFIRTSAGAKYMIEHFLIFKDIFQNKF